MKLEDKRCATVAAVAVSWAAVAIAIEYLSGTQLFTGITIGLIGFIVSALVCMFLFERQDRRRAADAKRRADGLARERLGPVFAHVPGPGEPGYDPNYDPDEDKYARRYYRDDE